MRNMLDYYRSSPDKDQLLVDLKHWESTGEPLTLETAIAFFETFKGEDRTLANIYGGTEMMDNIYCYWTSIEEFKGSLSHENRVSSIDKNRRDFRAICHISDMSHMITGGFHIHILMILFRI